MSARRLIFCCLGALAGAVLLAGCGSGKDVTGADIDPQIAADLSGQLDRIESFFNEGNCERAAKAVENLKTQADLVKGKTGEQFNANMNEIADNLAEKVDEDCQEAEPTTTTETTTTETTTTKETTTSTPSPPTQPGGGNPGGGNPGGGNPGGGNGGPASPGGGVTPGRQGGGG